MYILTTDLYKKKTISTYLRYQICVVLEAVFFVFFKTYVMKIFTLETLKSVYKTGFTVTITF